MKLEPLKYYDKQEKDGDKINLFLDDSEIILKSFSSEFNEYLFPTSKKIQIKNLLKTLIDHIGTLRIDLDKFFRSEYRYKLAYSGNIENSNFHEHLQNHGLVGNELKLKLSLAQDARDELIFADRILQKSHMHNEDLFYPKEIDSKKNIRERKLKLKNLEHSLKTAKQKKGINWFKVSISILKSIFGFFGMGKAIDELFDLLNSIFGDIPLKHEEF